MNILCKIIRKNKCCNCCRCTRGDFNNVNIRYRELNEFLRLHPSISIVDVRSNQEYKEGHIRKAINIPLYEIDRNIEKNIPNYNKEILLYCKSGTRSRKAIDKLRKKGYTNLYNIEDGIES